jgi:hypothetical protein
MATENETKSEVKLTDAVISAAVAACGPFQDTDTWEVNVTRAMSRIIQAIQAAKLQQDTARVTVHGRIITFEPRITLSSGAPGNLARLQLHNTRSTDFPTENIWIDLREPNAPALVARVQQMVDNGIELVCAVKEKRPIVNSTGPNKGQTRGHLVSIDPENPEDRLRLDGGPQAQPALDEAPEVPAETPTPKAAPKAAPAPKSAPKAAPQPATDAAPLDSTPAADEPDEAQAAAWAEFLALKAQVEALGDAMPNLAGAQAMIKAAERTGPTGGRVDVFNDNLRRMLQQATAKTSAPAAPQDVRRAATMIAAVAGGLPYNDNISTAELDRLAASWSNQQVSSLQELMGNPELYQRLEQEYAAQPDEVPA